MMDMNEYRLLATLLKKGVLSGVQGILLSTITYLHFSFMNNLITKMPYSKFVRKITCEMMEGQRINATEDMFEVLFLDILDPCVNLREVPQNLRIAGDEGEQTLGECFIRADGTTRESSAQPSFFVELIHAELITSEPVCLLAGHGQVQRLRSELIAFGGAELIVVPIHLLHLGQFFLYFQATLQSLPAVPEDKPSADHIGPYVGYSLAIFVL